MPTASSGGARGAPGPPSLVWSTSQTEPPTLVIGSAAGSPARVLGEGRAPRMSPDGRWVAYIRDEHTYLLATRGGRPWLVARNARPASWSQTSRYLATVDQRRTALYVTDLTTRRRVTIDRGAIVLGASLAPSGRYVVWGRQRAQSTGGKGADLFRARVDGSNRTRLTRGGRSTYPVWGRRWIAFGRIRSSGDPVFPVYELWTMRATGDGLRRLTRASHAPVAWSADGRRLLTFTSRRSQVVVSLVDAQTGRIRPLIGGQFVLPLSLSKDGGSVLAWALSPTRKPEGDLIRVSLERGRTTLVKNTDELADWNL